MVTAPLPNSEPAYRVKGGVIRPVNLRTDLAPLADLIEMVFAPTMDEGGRAAIREMRYLSKMGVGLSVISQLNEMMLGIKMGYVWIEDEKLIGNVSLYPASLPGGQRGVWIVANVGVHPAYQGRGIARQLMQQAMQMLASRGEKAAILQVDHDNQIAIHLYETLGFVRERAFTTWRRSSLAPAPPPVDTGVFITRRRRSEWQAEMRLAQETRPQEQGGVGWLKPNVPALFRKSAWREMLDWLTMNTTERLIVRTADESDLLAALWIENSLGSYSTRLTLLHHPEHPEAAHALLNNAVRRYRTSSLTLEHPADDAPARELFRSLRFTEERTVIHMRAQL